MLRNYLIIAFRNLLRQKVYSTINISGLAIGIAFCILTLLYVRFEWSYDAFHEKRDRIYLLFKAGKGANTSGGKQYVRTPWPLTAALIAWLTVSWQAIRAALANPVEALRYE